MVQANFRISGTSSESIKQNAKIKCTFEISYDNFSKTIYIYLLDCLKSNFVFFARMKRVVSRTVEFENLVAISRFLFVGFSSIDEFFFSFFE